MTEIEKIVQEKHDYHARNETLQRLEFVAGHKCALERAEYHRGWKEAMSLMKDEMHKPKGGLFDQ